MAGLTNWPGGVVIYLDFVMDANSMLLTSTPGINTTPSIFVNHTPGSVGANGAPNGTSDLGNVHTSFLGLMIFDTAKHFNAQSTIIGGMVSLADGTQSGNVFANGGFTLDYSAAALAALPSLQVAGNPVQLKSWTEQGPNLTMSVFSECESFITGSLSSVSTYVGTGVTLQ
jgi:hypothetical protein